MKDRNKSPNALSSLPNPFKKANTAPSAKTILELATNFEKAVIDEGHRRPDVPVGIALRVRAMLEEADWIVAADMSSARINNGNVTFHVASPENDPKEWVDHVKSLKKQLAEAEKEAAETAEPTS